ncbi:hypothetical protein LCGC14_1052750 [marine sediment metagenome]|uniref:Uncharacterized protein n=1 Tax=marine sediment metagenome TaxID=412755 RepID=A0A0F9QUF5_9ZZZZ
MDLVEIREKGDTLQAWATNYIFRAFLIFIQYKFYIKNSNIQIRSKIWL